MDKGTSEKARKRKYGGIIQRYSLCFPKKKLGQHTCKACFHLQCHLTGHYLNIGPTGGPLTILEPQDHEIGDKKFRDFEVPKL